MRLSTFCGLRRDQEQKQRGRDREEETESRDIGGEKEGKGQKGTDIEKKTEKKGKERGERTPKIEVGDMGGESEREKEGKK